MVKLKTKQEFNDFIQNNPICCVKFGAEWCGPCKTLDKRIEEAEEKGFSVKIGECDIDDEEVYEIGSMYGIKNIPFICAFKDGEVKDIAVGLVQIDTINNMVNAIG
jgi:thioredoxin 1